MVEKVSGGDNGRDARIFFFFGGGGHGEKCIFCPSFWLGVVFMGGGGGGGERRLGKRTERGHRVVGWL